MLASKTMKILFIQTGGTIDKDYPRGANSYAFVISDPAVKRILSKVNSNFEFTILRLLKKDSLDLTDKDRQKIYDACIRSDTDKIIITHGTDTMVETARKLSTIKNKVIILTGSLRPEKFSDSDASFNIGTAVGAINILMGGVFIVMSGRVYPWDKSMKEGKTGQFIEK